MARSRTPTKPESSEHARGEIAEEQAALRRVATLVAAGAPPARVFESVISEVGRLIGADGASMTRIERGTDVTSLGTWSRTDGYQRVARRYRRDPGTLAALTLETGLPSRINFDSGVGGELVEFARAQGWRSAVGAPVIVDGHIWGLIAVASTTDRLLPDDTESRLAKFSELLGTAISNTKRAEEVALLVQEQTALRRVATLVARGVPPAQVFAAVAREVGRLLDVDATHLGRYETDDAVVGVASWSRGQDRLPEGIRVPLAGDNVSDLVRRSGRPARIDTYDGAAGPLADSMRNLGIRSSVGVPIIVEGRLWGVIAVSSKGDDPLPSDTEARTAGFTELVATAIANSESRSEVTRLAEEQAALRRVATLVARESSPAEIFETVAAEVAQVLDTAIGMLRFEPDATATLVAQSATPWDPPPMGTRFPLDGDDVVVSVFRTRKAARFDDWTRATGATALMAERLGIRSTVAAPIIVQGRLWGTMVAASARTEPLPADTESRLGEFTELVATAISNAEARGALSQLAEEQAALRRVATLVAQGAPPAEVFDAVIEEVAQLLGAAQVALSRFESSDEILILALRGADPEIFRTGMRLPLDGDSLNARVLRSGRSARLDLYAEGTGTIADSARRASVNVTVGAPIVVEGTLWGVMSASWMGEDVPPADAEERLTDFAELLDTAIANADSRDQLTASRARVLTAGDEARRKVVRDLHDGAQQRLVHSIVSLKLAQHALKTGDGRAESLVEEALVQAERGNAELRELAHGILPSVLTRGGLRAGVDTLVSRIDIPVELHVSEERLPEEIEASAYFIVAEALTNVVKHSGAGHAAVTAIVHDGTLSLRVIDDGVGGADPQGHGLIGLGDRVAALGGRLRIESPPGGGTVVAAELPLSYSGAPT